MYRINNRDLRFRLAFFETILNIDAKNGCNQYQPFLNSKGNGCVDNVPQLLPDEWERYLKTESRDGYIASWENTSENSWTYYRDDENNKTLVEYINGLWDLKKIKTVKIQNAT